MERLDANRDSGTGNEASSEGWSASTLAMSCCSSTSVGLGEKGMPQERNRWLGGKLKGKQSQIYFTICLGPKNDA